MESISLNRISTFILWNRIRYAFILPTGNSPCLGTSCRSLIACGHGCTPLVIQDGWSGNHSCTCPLHSRHWATRCSAMLKVSWLPSRSSHPSSIACTAGPSPLSRSRPGTRVLTPGSKVCSFSHAELCTELTTAMQLSQLRALASPHSLHLSWQRTFAMPWVDACQFVSVESCILSPHLSKSSRQTSRFSSSVDRSKESVSVSFP